MRNALQPVSRVFADRPLRLVLATTVLAIGAALAAPSEAAPPHGGMVPGGPMMLMGGPGGLDKALDRIGASADQKSQIQAIMKSAHDDLRGQRDANRQLHEQMQALFTATTVDARAVETLRQQQLAQHDAQSKRMTQAMIDASRVLSVDQRKALGEQMAQRRTMMERHRGEREALDGKPAR